ncbi:MAG: peptidase S10 [Alphaproteobacteria bacterium]|nr:peptidase S10 [Alphaproteobacteria bacterium]MBU1514045.1 peptidase S10 [Alphaproteobacteria bacterium]MBU2093015.1 peptidase S10 [Alphaproteobacteria bacterium]MBU2151782.1 peptidase S10 [Alphaproteobacteria bacterium]MBU2309398.1 peptidase S10 [Alphaproteobacteria bacterium]
MHRRSVLAAAFAIGVGTALPALAEDAKPDTPKPDAAKIDLPKFPAEASVKQTTRVAGKTLNYTATIGALPVRDEKGKTVAEVVFTAYVLDGARDPSRPVTFAFNGGPGAASVYLNLGAIGPKRVQFGAQGDSPSDSAQLIDNPGTWLDFTDMVFIDPVGTGFSRSLVDKEETKKRFYSITPDIEYLSRIVYDWLVKNGRMASPKYVTGESYGGFRAPKITYYLQTKLGVGVNGVVLVSPYLEPPIDLAPDVSPMPWVSTLPSMAASNYERQGKALSPALMAEVEAYARGEFVTDLMKGRRDPAAVARLVDKVTAYTGLNREFVKISGGRIDSRAYLRELYRQEGKIGSWYDSNVTQDDPFPWSPEGRRGDPILDAIIAPTTSAMVDFTTRVVGWKVEGRYNALSDEVGENWEKGVELTSATTDLRQAVAADPKMKVLVVHGYDDLSCPYFISRLIIDQMPISGDPNRVRLALYPGGHMFYSRPASQAAFRADVMQVFGAR